MLVGATNLQAVCFVVLMAHELQKENSDTYMTWVALGVGMLFLIMGVGFAFVMDNLAESPQEKEDRCELVANEVAIQHTNDIAAAVSGQPLPPAASAPAPGAFAMGPAAGDLYDDGGEYYDDGGAMYDDGGYGADPYAQDPYAQDPYAAEEAMYDDGGYAEQDPYAGYTDEEYALALEDAQYAEPQYGGGGRRMY